VCGQTDRQTDTLITLLHTPTGGGGVKRKSVPRHTKTNLRLHGRCQVVSVIILPLTSNFREPFAVSHSFALYDIRTRSSTDDEIARNASHWMPPKCETSHFPMPRITIRVVFNLQIAKTPACHVICPFPLFVALCDHNPPTLRTDRQTSCS